MGLGWFFRPLAAATTIAFSTLGLLSRRYQRARFYFHLSLYTGILGLTSLWGVFVSVLATAAGQRLNINYFVARSFYYACHPLIGMPIEVEGEEHLNGLMTAREGKHQPAVLVGNHQSLLDILYLGRILPKRAAIMAKQELKWMPLLGQFMALSGAVFVDRKNRKDAVRALEQAGDDMKKKGVSLWVFPEGTRSLSPEPALLPFKKGAFHLAVQAQVPIIPVVCDNYHRLFDGRTRLERGKLHITVLPPISTVGLNSDDVTLLSESTRELMLRTLRDGSVPVSDSAPSSTPATVVDDVGDTPAQSEPQAEMPSTLRQGSEDREDDLKDSNDRGDEATEDEMDEDAVLLKRPKEQ